MCFSLTICVLTVWKILLFTNVMARKHCLLTGYVFHITFSEIL